MQFLVRTKEKRTFVFVFYFYKKYVGNIIFFKFGL